MCYDSNAQPPVPPAEAGAAHGDDLVLTSADGTRFAAYLAQPEGAPRAQLVIYPDVRGLHQFYKDLALRFAEQGVAALAIDYFGRTAGLGSRDDSFEYMPHVQQLNPDRFQQDVDAALARLREGDGASRPTFIVGFCMGGALTFVTATRDVGLAGAIGFYAGLSRGYGGGRSLLEQAMRIKYPVLALFGGADQNIPPDQVEAFDHELDRAGVEHEVVTYPGAPHSFFDRKQAEYADASSDAWKRVLGFIADHAM